MFTGSDGVGAGGIIIERVSGGGSWTSTGAMISSGFHYGATDGTVVYDNTFATAKLGKAIHFDSTNSVIKFINQTVASAVTPGVFPALAISSYTGLQLEFGSTARGVYVPAVDAAVSTTSACLTVNGAVNVVQDIVAGNAAVASTFHVSSSTVSTSTGTGSVIVAGGIGIGGTMTIGVNFVVVGTGSTSTMSGQLTHGSVGGFYGSMSIIPVIDTAVTHSMTSLDAVVFMTNTATRTVTLQACATAGVGRMIRFQEAGGTTNTITINTVSSEIINGGGVASSTSRTITTAYGYILLITNGTAWYVLSNA
jgi:hypothetical protein